MPAGISARQPSRNGDSSAATSIGAHVGEHADAVADQHVGIVERRRPDVIIGRQGRELYSAHGAANRNTRGPEPPDLSEKGGIKNGQPQRSNDRLFMQFLAFGGCADTRRCSPMRSPARASTGVLYEDVNDPRGVALLTFSDDPGVLSRSRAAAVERPAVRGAGQKPEYTMLGRTYAIGYEPDLTGSRCCTGRGGRCSIRRGSGRSGIRCAAAAGSRSCPRRSSA